MTSVATAGTVALRRRPRWHAYLLLSRVSNLPTVWTNVLAGMCVVSAAIDGGAYLRVALAMSAFYTGGMFLNDAFDEPFDRVRRPERPIPSGDVSRREVFVSGTLLLLAGELLLAPRVQALVFGGFLAAAIVWYDAQHKGSRFAPVVMGSCRGLVYCAAAAFAGSLSDFTAAIRSFPGEGTSSFVSENLAIIASASSPPNFLSAAANDS